MTDLDIIAQLEAKVQQLPPDLIDKVNHFVNELLQKCNETSTNSLPTSSSFYQIKPVSLGLKVENVDNIATLLEEYE